MYVAVKGGTTAIENSWRLLAAQRRGDAALPALSVAQIRSQMSLAVDRVMSEGSLYDPELAALAIKQASGDLIEAVFLLRAYRTTLPRFGYSLPLDTAQMQITRRVSATFKDVPGGQVLGATYDYTQRLLDFALLAEDHVEGATTATTDTADSVVAPATDKPLASHMPRVNDLMAREGLIETPRPTATDEPRDLTREPLMFPADRTLRLQALARGDEGWLLGLGYSTQRGYANAHPFAGEIRRGQVAVEIMPDELGFAIDIGDIDVTECQMINQFAGNRDVPPQFTQGYGLAFGGAERKSMAMALVDRALRARELGEVAVAPAQDEEFVLSHSDNLESSGFVQHLKLPHYVDFQSELELVRKLRAAHARDADSGAPTAPSDNTSLQKAA
ncbi:carbon-phosphorus lyase complex subunit PhnI [Polaromonas sp. YR568]|uniref:carbon-phosphorus lyase complex subunit PhnI n=1 Tax=Polaromonas sp. YR568 TaxID=1855301 RepID=UPI003137A6A2